MSAPLNPTPLVTVPGPTPWPQSGNLDGTTPATDFNPLTTNDTTIPDVAGGIANFIANILIEILGALFDGICSLFSGTPITGTTSSQFMSGSQNAMDTICNLFSGGGSTNTSGTSMIAGTQSVIGTGSNLLTGDSGSITSGSGLIDGFITLLNLLCSLCGGSMFLNEQAQERRTGRLSDRARERLGLPPNLGTVTPLVNGASLVAGIQNWIGTGSYHLTGDPTALASGHALAEQAQSQIDFVHGILGGMGTGTAANAVLALGTQYHSDALGLLGNPLGLGTGSPTVSTDPNAIPILAPANAANQDVIDKLFGALTGISSTGNSAANLGNAAAILATTAGNAATQAQVSQTYVDLMAINSAGHHAVDPSLTATFDLLSITGTSSDTISVTGTVSAIGFIHIPAAATKSSIAWYGGGVTGLSSAFLNLFSVDPATGILTLVWSSANIISSINATVGWTYVAMPSVAVAQNTWYAVELAVFGSGTHTMVGLPSHWLAANPVTFPKQLGATRNTTSGGVYVAPGATIASPPAGSVAYSANVPWLALSSQTVTTQGTYAPVPTPFTVPGTYTYSIPFWASFIDLVGIGGGGDGSAAGILGNGLGGSAGTWNGKIIERAVDFMDSPTATLTIVVGRGGISGGAGVNTTISWTDTLGHTQTMTCTGGAAATQSTYLGQSATIFIFDGQPYDGGGFGKAPGGGGNGGTSGLFGLGGTFATGGGSGGAFTVARAGSGTAREIPLSAAVFGSGVLSATAGRKAGLAGAGALSAAGGGFPYTFPFVFGASGPFARYLRPAVLSGHGALTAIAGRRNNLIGHGQLSATAVAKSSTLVPLLGHGVLSTPTKVILPATLLPGAGALSAAAGAGVHASLFGAGALSAKAGRRANLVGVGALSAAIKVKLAAKPSGHGVLSATAKARYARAAAPSGHGALSATAGNPVTFKGVNGGTNSVTLPSHNVGDIIVIAAFTGTSNTPATKPVASGTVPAWNIIYNTTGTNGCAFTVAYFVATATNHTSGLWLGASVEMAAVVLTGQGPTPIGGLAVATSASTSAPSAPAVTLSQTDATSALLEFYESSATGTWAAAPTGYTQRLSVTSGFCVNTKNTTTSDGAIAQTAGGTGIAGGVQLEIRAH
jgi:hypothetical protein